MLRFRPRIGPFVWVPGPRRARVPSMPSMPWVTLGWIAVFVLGPTLGVLLAWWWSS